MYFKQLELIGFKSFADRTILKFDPGITAVVGPNGCGKSNILDSIRWVLGEQRPKELRGSHMQDVVFNGTDSRHPLGMAEVTVTFDNSDSVLPVDFAEVQISRRIYRSGESEYLINKAPCRLKDIQELFMDTGIGTQAYSMIGQGKMDMILSSKPEDRRYIFEEAAGIIKYKTRKRLAVRRLEQAEQNLLRLGDIIAEVERQMRSLKRQVNAAIRYRELSDQLRDVEIRSAWREYTRLTAEIADLKSGFAKSRDQYESVSTQISSHEARHEEVALNRLEVERVRLARQQGVYEIESEMEKIDREIALVRQQIEYCGEREGVALREKEALIERASGLESSSADVGTKSTDIQAEITACDDALASKTEEHEQAAQTVADKDKQLEAARRFAAERMTDRARAQTALEKLAETILAVDARLGMVYERQRGVTSRQEELLVSLNAAREEDTIKQQAYNEVVRERDEAVASRNRESEVLRDLDEQWRTHREDKSSTEARLNSLREMRDNYEGFASGVRAVMKAAGGTEVRDIIGPAGDLLSSDKEYEQAIEAALGGSINNIVVENADAAKSAIEFLKKNQAGRVTFLPLDTLHPSTDHGAPPANAPFADGQPGVVGSAIRFVRYEPRLRNVVDFLLRDTVIVRTLDDAIRIARATSRHPKLVSLDGEVVASSGAVTGGRTRHETRGLLGRSAEIADLEERVTSVDARIAETTARRDSVRTTIGELVTAIAGFEDRIAALRHDLNELTVLHARQSTELENLGDVAQSLDQERDELSGRREGLEAQRHEATTHAESMQSDDERIQQETADVQEAAAQAREALSVCTSELADLRVRQEGLRQRAGEVERERLRLVREREDALAEAARRDEAIIQIGRERETLKESVAQHIERAKALSETREEASQKAIEAQNQLQQLLDESEVIEKELKQLRDQARTAQSEVHRIELNLRQNEDRVGFFQERILSEYGIALSSVNEEQAGTDELDDEARAELVTELRGKLQRMGEVNLMAIEEYEELEQRHAFLAAQAQDLHQARETLLGVIARSDVRIREMFMETFVNIAENFSAFFRRLFNGGQARVYLLDEDDPLECGIEIEARPPGKKPTSISLLSGGESAMTAVALLFSIFKAKPSPFCVLDEVDAPLDDANIGRFLTIVDEFTDQSQFVVITHNKQTMSKADVLYGVTMQERGVSQLVGVKLNGA